MIWKTEKESTESTDGVILSDSSRGDRKKEQRLTNTTPFDDERKRRRFALTCDWQ